MKKITLEAWARSAYIEITVKPLQVEPFGWAAVMNHIYLENKSIVGTGTSADTALLAMVDTIRGKRIYDGSNTSKFFRAPKGLYHPMPAPSLEITEVWKAVEGNPSWVKDLTPDMVLDAVEATTDSEKWLDKQMVVKNKVLLKTSDGLEEVLSWQGQNMSNRVIAKLKKLRITLLNSLITN